MWGSSIKQKSIYFFYTIEQETVLERSACIINEEAVYENFRSYAQEKNQESF